MSQENVEIVQQSFLVWQATGEPAWDLLDEEITVHDHDLMDVSEYRGPQGAARWLEDWATAWADYDAAPEEFIDVGERVVAVLRLTVKGRSSGIVVDRQDAIVYLLRDRKILRVDYYNSRQQALDSIGLDQ